ncbi:MAG: sodium-coupled permease [Balneola sp.]|jgi:Na+/proline symporter|nr:sodium-coupled permease [Balneola sp.]MBE80791.1 sodium-coupled permease [Balneola sp.]HBX67329.1 sodium-coupled permease [Balneolaceae bacterium]|tara:strand:- start:116 stop:1846 length:1731 start_codon:yes stop_codon:yes gene_type:complete
MSWIDWSVLIIFLGYTVWDGTRQGKDASTIEGYLLANRSMPWWAAGLSVMATQASAITFIGTTGIAYVEDMRFVQTYLAIPFAMIFICMFLVPFFNKMQNFTAYEVLEERFGLKTRLTTSGLFLISRGLALGVVIAAPSYVLALLLGLPLNVTIIIIGIIATGYTTVGGIAGVINTDVKQMAVMMFGLIFCFGLVWMNLPENVDFGDALYLAGSLDKLTALDLNFDLSEKYNVWSGVIAAFFLMVSYFGTDQTQVQRYLTTDSVKNARKSLLLTAYAKVPMQFFILLLGVMLYVFFIFNPAPASFRATEPVAEQQEFRIAEERILKQYDLAHIAREDAALAAVQNRSKENQQAFINADREMNEARQADLALQAEIQQADVNDTNYIFPYFILNHVPIGIIGLIVGGIFAAALSSIDSELNALTTVSIVDWYRRLKGDTYEEMHYVKSSRGVTFMWGAIATVSALLLGETKSIIELINQIGSYFYGSILGVFVLLLWVKRATGTGALIGLISGMASVFTFDRLFYNATTADYSFIFPWSEVPDGYTKAIEFLWLNPVGTIMVVMVGLILSYINPRKS